MSNILKSNIYAVTSLIVGIAIGLVLTRVDTNNKHPGKSDLRVWTFHIVYSPGIKENYMELDNGGTTLFSKDMDEVVNTRGQVFDYLRHTIKLAE